MISQVGILFGQQMGEDGGGGGERKGGIQLQYMLTVNIT